jgi:cytochrome c1
VWWKPRTRRLRPGAALSPGAALVASEGCLACHAMGDQGERRGPRLEWIATRRDAGYVARYLASPASLTPGSVMPAYDKLAESQRRSIAEFVISLADGKEDGREP